MHDLDRAMSPAGGARRRGVALGVLSAAAALLHLAALGGVAWAWPSAETPQLPAAATAPVLQVRVVDAGPAPAAAVRAEVATPAPTPEATPATPAAPAAAANMAVAGTALLLPRAQPAPPSVAAVAASTRSTRVARAVAVAPAARAMTVALPAAPIERATGPVPAVPESTPPLRLAQAGPAAAPAASPSAAASSPAHEDEPIPHYRTRIPPATALRYEMQRGILRGTGDLLWRPQGDRYELRLEAKVGSLAVLTQVSSGGFDAEGVAPLRFTDQRLRRSPTAANFQRGGVDKITYSGSASEFALRPGAQDRLSWMVQLAAITAAEPALAKPGGRVAMLVTGARGDAGVWVFRCIGPERVEARGTQVDAIKFVREPREAHDTSVEVWLDPTQHDLPLRAVQKSGANDEPYELRLLEVLPAN